MTTLSRIIPGGCRIAVRGLQLWMAASSEQLRAWNSQVEDDLLSPPSDDPLWACPEVLRKTHSSFQKG